MSDDNEDDLMDEMDDEDSSLLVNVPLFETPEEGAPKPSKREQPPEGLTWQDDAILSCFQVAVDTHKLQVETKEGTEETIPASFLWSAPSSTDNGHDNDDWTPKPIPLPIWAATLDPTISGILLVEDNKRDEASNEAAS